MEVLNSQADANGAVDEAPSDDGIGATDRRWPRARVIQWAATAGIVVVAEVVFFAGNARVSYLIDAVAVAVFFGLRRARE